MKVVKPVFVFANESRESRLVESDLMTKISSFSFLNSLLNAFDLFTSNLTRAVSFLILSVIQLKI